MTIMNTDPRERLKQIRRWRVMYVSANSDPYADLSRAFGEIDFLLSLLDSQAAGGLFPTDDELVVEMNAVAEQLVREWYCESQHRDELVDEIAVTLTATHSRAEARGATSMRDLCVEQVKGLYDEYESLECAAESIVLSKAVGALESLTLDQVEQKQ